MKLIVHGYTGRMGQIVSDLAANGYNSAQLAARVGRSCPAPGQDGCYAALSQYDGPADCVVDFSSHLATGELLGYCLERRLPLVIAATGHTEAERALIEEAAGHIPIFFSANMSIGIALLARMAQKAAAVFPEADIEIVEIHHNRKQDVPSGTALLLYRKLRAVRPGARAVVGRHEDGRRAPEEIGIHSLRCGNEVGTHEIIIASGSETITLRHRAESRALFAQGALAAAAFLRGRGPGLYGMEDMISL